MSSFRIVLLIVGIIPIILLQANPVITPIPANRITLIFNQPKFAPGDTAFFAAQLYTEYESKAEDRQIVTFKLSGNDSLIHVTERVSFLKGTGIGQLIIPETIEPGVYTLSAYKEAYPINAKPEILSAPFIIAGTFHFSMELQESQIAVQHEGIKLDINQEVLQPRNEVTCKVIASNNLLSSMVNHYTVTVYRKNLFVNETKTALPHIIHLLPSSHEEPSSNKRADGIKYYFRGKAILENPRQPVRDSTLITFYLIKYDLVFGVYTRNGGDFVFPLFQDFENQEAFYTLSYRKKILTDARLVLEHHGVPKNTDQFVSQVPDPYGDYWLHKKTILSSYRYYSSKKVKRAPSAPDTWVDTDIEVDLKKYEPFTSVSEMFINIVPMARYRKTKDTESIRIFLDKDAVFAEQDPVFIIDGIMTNNTAYILSIKADAIQKIGVIRTEPMLARYGDLGVNGIIVIETSIPNHATIIPRTPNSIFITGISKPIQYQPKYYTPETLKTRIPDMRSCLYWNPQVSGSSQETEFKFFTSDDTGDFVIHVSALLKNGNLIQVSKSITVKSPEM